MTARRMISVTASSFARVCAIVGIIAVPPVLLSLETLTMAALKAVKAVILYYFYKPLARALRFALSPCFYCYGDNHFSLLSLLSLLRQLARSP